MIETGTAVERYGHLRVEGIHLVSAAGEPVQLRGVSSMWLNWEEDGYARDVSALRFMRDSWGLQIIRAAMGVEADGGYATSGKASMVAQVNQIVENAALLGVYVIVDFHTHHAEDYQAEAIEFFSDISARYGHLPNLILEPYNEPLAVNWGTTLKPYHEAVLAAIRQNDPDGISNVAILGTPNWDQDVDAVIGQRVEDPYTMYTVHFYSCTHGAPLLNKAKSALCRRHSDLRHGMGRDGCGWWGQWHPRLRDPTSGPVARLDGSTAHWLGGLEARQLRLRADDKWRRRHELPTQVHCQRPRRLDGRRPQWARTLRDQPYGLPLTSAENPLGALPCRPTEAEAHSRAITWKPRSVSTT